MKRKWNIRSYKETDLDALYKLTKAVWGEDVPEKEQWIRGWQWVHLNNPAGTSVIWIAEHDGRLVGQYPLILESMKIGGQIVKGSQNIDIMTHPEYRRQGMAAVLEKTALDELSKKGIHLVIGFPNQPAYPLHMKSGWLDVCAFQVMVKPLNLRKFLERYFTRRKPLLKVLTLVGNLIIKAFFRTRKPPAIHELSIEEISYFDDRFDDFWNRIPSDYPLIVVRDKRYLNWRYVDAPNARYTIYAAEEKGQICGYIVLGCTYDNGLALGHIYDIIAPLDREDIIRSLMSKAIEHFRDKEVDAIFSKMVANKVYHKSLSKSGFIPHFRFKSRFIAYSASKDVSVTFIKDSKNWFIQLGDSPGVY